MLLILLSDIRLQGKKTGEDVKLGGMGKGVEAACFAQPYRVSKNYF